MPDDTKQPTADRPAATRPTVRAIVVTWNGADLLPSCLDSLLAQADVNIEIVVVDNASTDHTQALLTAAYPGVRVLTLPENVGFAGGVAAATDDLLDSPDQAEIDYVVLLNNDAAFAPEAVSTLVATAEADRRLGAVTALVLLAEPAADGQRLVNSTGNVWTGAGATDRDYGRPLDEVLAECAGTPAAKREVFGFNGGAALLRTQGLRETGGFDASLFLYYEDTDLSFRLRRAGWTVAFEPRAVATHRHMASTGGGKSPLFRYYNTRNSLLVARRHLPAGTWVAALGRQTLGALKASLLRTEPQPVRAARWRGLRDSLRNSQPGPA
ncbi:MAG: glycosyltransferase family 2 protein [Promicromonosporaceae bacterium]|nr:glycosyltransferase family 2 protein [Promicromonosporaceae bacterium]